MDSLLGKIVQSLRTEWRRLRGKDKPKSSPFLLEPGQVAHYHAQTQVPCVPTQLVLVTDPPFSEVAITLGEGFHPHQCYYQKPSMGYADFVEYNLISQAQPAKSFFSLAVYNKTNRAVVIQVAVKMRGENDRYYICAFNRV
jgi:hypothetical protein